MKAQKDEKGFIRNGNMGEGQHFFCNSSVILQSVVPKAGSQLCASQSFFFVMACLEGLWWSMVPWPLVRPGHLRVTSEVVDVHLFLPWHDNDKMKR